LDIIFNLPGKEFVRIGSRRRFEHIGKENADFLDVD
jgi:hypothetical protein